MAHKFAALCAVISAVAALDDYEPPVISLHLEDKSPLDGTYTSVYHNQIPWSSTTPGEDLPGFSEFLQATQADPNTRVCEVGSDMGTTCKLPVAKAWDMHSGDLSDSITKSETLAISSLPQSSTPQYVGSQENAISSDIRGEWMLRYNVADEADNQAEEVQFVVLMRDTHAPNITFSTSNAIMEARSDSTDTNTGVRNIGQSYSIEGCAGWERYVNLDYDISATDNYDGDVSVTLQNIDSTTMTHSSDPQRLVVDTQSATDTVNSAHFTAQDYAGVFGFDFKNNVANLQVDVTVTDTTKPKIFCNQGRVSALDPNAWDSDTDCPLTDPDAPDGVVVPSAEMCSAATHLSRSYRNDYWEGAQTDSSHECTPIYHECGDTMFTEPDYLCFDEYDSWMPVNQAVTSLSVTKSDPDGLPTDYASTPDVYDFTLDCADAAGVSADTRTRKVHVEDTLAPTLSLGSLQVAQIRGAQGANNLTVGPDAGWTCDDLCDSSDELTMQYDLYTGGTCGGGAYICEDPTTGMEMECSGNDPSNQRISVELYGNETNYDTWDNVPMGTYGLRYTCTDQQGHSQARCRTVDVVDPPAPPGPYNLPILGEFFVIIEYPLLACEGHDQGDANNACLGGLTFDIYAIKSEMLSKLEQPNPDNINVQWKTPAGTQSTNPISRRLEEEVEDDEDGRPYGLSITVFARGGPCRAKALQQTLQIWNDLYATDDINTNVAGGTVVLGTPNLYNALVVNTQEGADEGIQNATNTDADLYRVPDSFEFLQGESVYMIMKIGNWEPDRDIKDLGASLGPIVSDHLSVPQEQVMLSRVEARFTEEIPPRLDTWVTVSIEVDDPADADAKASLMNGGCAVEGQDLDRAIHPDEVQIDPVTGYVLDQTFVIPGGSCFLGNALAWKVFNGTGADLNVQTLSITTPPTYSETPPFCQRPVISSESGTQFRFAAEEEHGNFSIPDDVTCEDVDDGNIDYRLTMATEDPLTIPKNIEKTYTYTYDCKNWLVVPAKQFERTVQVYDGFCPVCQLPSPITYIEASFPYSYEELQCDEHPHVEMRSIEVNGTVNVEMTGTYVYTYHITDQYGNTNEGDCIGARSYVRTVIVEDSLQPVIMLKTNDGQYISSAGNGRRLASVEKHSLSLDNSGIALVSVIGAGVAGIALIALIVSRSKPPATMPPV